MTEENKQITMPRGGLYDADGNLSSAGQHYLAGVEKLSKLVLPAPDTATAAADVLAAGSKLVRSDSLWATMIPKAETTTFAPDLSAKLDFKVTVSGDITINTPTGVPGTEAEPYFSILLTMSGSGHTISFGAGFVADAPVPLSGDGDRCLLAGKIISRDAEGAVSEWIMWINADIAA